MGNCQMKSKLLQSCKSRNLHSRGVIYPNFETGWGYARALVITLIDTILSIIPINHCIDIILISGI